MKWTKLVRPNWRTWCGNVLPEEVPAISDGYSVFLREASNPQRYKKLETQRSIYRLNAVTLDADGAVPLRIERLLDVREFVKVWAKRRTGLPIRYVAILRGSDGRPVLVNAERLRCAALVCGHDNFWRGEGDRVYLCDTAPEELDLFATGPAPVAMVMPLLPAARLMTPLEDYEREHGPCDAHPA